MRVAREQNLTLWAVGALLLLSFACKEPLREVPADLIGIWETEGAGYSGRFLEIRTHLVRFGTGEGADAYEVLGSTREQLNSEMAYTIVYQDEESDRARLHLIYDPAARSLRLRSRPQYIWWRRGEKPPPTDDSRPPAAPERRR